MSYGMTRAQAERQARVAISKMKIGGKWVPKVWVNLGWCWSISNGFFDVFGGDPDYHCLPKPNYSMMFVPERNWSRDPNRVVRRVARHIRDILRDHRDMYEPALRSVGVGLDDKRKKRRCPRTCL